MTYQEYCDRIRKNYRPLHPHLYELRDEFFVPELVRAVRGGTPAALRQLYREPHPQIYVFDMLRPEFLHDLLAEAAWFEEWCGQNDLGLMRPNSMNNYGTVLDSFGFSPFLQQLMLKYIQPFSSLMYPEVGGATLDSHHGFIVEYKVGKDVALDFHVDASDVTLNVCLGKEFTGGTLFSVGSVVDSARRPNRCLRKSSRFAMCPVRRSCTEGSIATARTRLSPGTGIT